jgi:hypothetical protein
VTDGGFDLGIAFDGDGDRMLAVDGDGEAVDGDQILAVLALHLGVDLVAVTVMTNLGFHQLMGDHGIEVVVTDVGDRYVLEALRERDGLLGGEQSGHIIYLRDHAPATARCGVSSSAGAERAHPPRGGGRHAPLPAGRRTPVATKPASRTARRGRAHQPGTGRRGARSRPTLWDRAGRTGPSRSEGFPKGNTALC